MFPYWLIETWEGWNSDTNKILSLLKEMDLPYKTTQYVPFQGESYDYFPDNSKVVVFGSINLISQLQKEKNWYPLAWCNWDILTFSYYYQKYDPDILLNFPFFTTVREFIDNLNKFFTDDAPIFVRPDANDKRFDGDVIEKENIDSFVSLLEVFLTNGHINEDDQIIVSKKKDIKEEYRLVISNKRIITGSTYRVGDVLKKREITDLSELQSWVNTNIHWEPHEIYVMDVAKLEDNSFKLIEIGSINCAGIYECNVEKIIDRILEL